ncbi:MAG: hypothetical protein ACRDHW_11160, partial [Ktedonobacteraceae bacterium]
MLHSLLTTTLHCALDERVLILNSAADPCLPHLAQQISAGELLLAEDNLAAAGRAQMAIQRLGKTRPHVHHLAFHEYSAHELPATVDTAVLNILYQPN